MAPHSRWRQNALHPPQVQHGAAGRDTSGCFPVGGLRCTAWNTRGLFGSVFSSQRNRERKHNYFKKLLECNNILCLQEVHGKDEFLQTLQVLAPRFQLFGTIIPGNENAGGTASCIHKDLLPDDATVTHFVTCPRRGHTVSIQSDWTKLVIVSVHFEPELTVRRLRERLRHIIPHCPSYPNAMGFIMEDCSVSLHFPKVLEIAQPDFTRKDSSANGIIRTLSRIDRIFTNMPKAEARDFHCYSHVFENLGNRTIPSDHTAVRLAIQKPTNWRQQDKRIPGWMSKHPVFCSILKRLHDGHRYSDEPFCALAEFKDILCRSQKAYFS